MCGVDDKPENQEVLVAANRYGFSLEFDTRKVLEESKQFDNIRCNEHFSLDGHEIEIDLLASHNNKHYVIECKGGKEGSRLILVKKHQYEKTDKPSDYNYLDKKESPGWIFPLFNLDLKEVPVVYTGDFFHKQKNNEFWTSISQHDCKNNLFKAISQLKDGLSIPNKLFDQPEQKSYKVIFPIIVTNASIWVVDYNGNEPNACQFHLALYESHNPRFVTNSKEQNKYFHTIIVNVDHLIKALEVCNSSNNNYIIDLSTVILNS